jgi:hypothetical protein
MQLITTGAYDYSADDFRDLSGVLPFDLEVLEGNAGLGADWPVGVFKSAQALALAIAVFSAPSTFKENWPLWKEIFDASSQLVLERFKDLRVDRDTAQMIAMHHAIESIGVRPDWLEIHMAIRHFDTGVGGYDDLLKTERVVLSWPEYAERGDRNFLLGVDSLSEAAKQAVSRYVFGITDFSGQYTVIVERDGRISFSSALR